MKHLVRRAENQAFSLTELLVGVAIGGLLVGLATPAVQAMLPFRMPRRG
jgi:prepilin-type N-terminal cleavage/methylation domain-containing protein